MHYCNNRAASNTLSTSPWTETGGLAGGGGGGGTAGDTRASEPAGDASARGPLIGCGDRETARATADRPTVPNGGVPGACRLEEDGRADSVGVPAERRDGGMLGSASAGTGAVGGDERVGGGLARPAYAGIGPPPKDERGGAADGAAAATDWPWGAWWVLGFCGSGAEGPKDESWRDTAEDDTAAVVAARGAAAG